MLYYLYVASHINKKTKNSILKKDKKMIKKSSLFILFLFVFAGLVYGQTAKSTLDGMMHLIMVR